MTSLANLTLSAIAMHGVELPASSCAPGTRWDDISLRRELSNALERIRHAPIVHEPFAHLRVEPLFSECLYADLLADLPDKSAYRTQEYAGTSGKCDCIRVNETRARLFGRAVKIPQDCCSSVGPNCPCYRERWTMHNSSKTGRVLPQSLLTDQHPLWVQAFRLVHSTDFTRLLVNRFSMEGGIPAWKQRHLRPAYRAGTLKNTAALRIEPQQYHLSPHVDVWEKLVTWQFFHPADDELSSRGLGTLFYMPAAGVELKVDTQKNPSWFGENAFEPVLEQRVMPNAFFAFAPNERSFHGASMDLEKWSGVRNKDARRTFLGFVTSPKDGFHHFGRYAGDWSSDSFSI